MVHGGSVVLVHGTWGRPESWRWVREPLERAGLEVIAVDLPSHRGPGPGLAEDADTVRNAVRSLIGPVVALGWSYGATVIAEAATSDLPVARLVFVSGLPGSESAEDLADQGWIDDNPSIATLPDGRFRLDRDAFLDEEGGKTLPEDVRADFREHGFRWANREIERPVTHEQWRAFPATVIYGDEDPLMPPEETEKNAARFDDVRVIECDHFVPYRKPGALADLVLETFGSTA